MQVRWPIFVPPANSRLRKQAEAMLYVLQRDISASGPTLGREWERAPPRYSQQAINRVTPKTKWVGLGREIRPQLVVYAQTLISVSPADQADARAIAKSRMVGWAAKPEVDGNLAKLLRDEIRSVWPAFPRQEPALSRPTLKTHAQAGVEGSDRFALSEPDRPPSHLAALSLGGETCRLPAIGRHAGSTSAVWRLR